MARIIGRKLDTYVWRELFVPFLIGTLAVQAMFMINQLMFIYKNFNLQQVPVLAVVQSILYKSPFWMNMTLPVGAALAASLAFTRLTRESELTAMRAAGASIMRTLVPVAIFGAFVGLGNFLMTEKVMPPAEKRFQEVFTKLGVIGVAPEFRSNAVIYLKDHTASFGSVVRAPDDSLQLRDILLIQRTDTGETMLFTAKEGEYRNGKWLIRRPQGWYFQQEDLISFNAGKDMEIDERIVIENVFATSEALDSTKTAAELKEAITTGRRTGVNTRLLEVSYYSRFSVPFACLIFAAVAPVFAIVFARTGGFAGVLLSFFLVLLYYNAFVVSTEIFGRNGWLSPVMAAWLPNVLFAVLGLVALRRLE